MFSLRKSAVQKAFRKTAKAQRKEARAQEKENAVQEARAARLLEAMREIAALVPAADPVNDVKCSKRGNGAVDVELTLGGKLYGLKYDEYRGGDRYGRREKKAPYQGYDGKGWKARRGRHGPAAGALTRRMMEEGVIPAQQPPKKDAKKFSL